MKVIVAVISTALMALYFVGSPFAAGLEGDGAKKDLDRLQGTWVLVTGEMDGSKVKDEHVAKNKLTWEGSKVTLISPHQHHEPLIVEIVKVDATKSPKQIHFMRKNGPGAGKNIIAIYEFEGDHSFHFAFDPTGAATPKELTAKEKTGHIKHTWKRQQQ